ncbi:MAG: hypothetical protein WD021_05275 [Rhodothermales bacterium]
MRHDGTVNAGGEMQVKRNVRLGDTYAMVLVRQDYWKIPQFKNKWSVQACDISLDERTPSKTN